MWFVVMASLLVSPVHGAPLRGSFVAFPVIPTSSGVMYSDVILRGNETTVVDVKSKGGNVDCTVFDSNANVVAEDNGPHNSCSIRIKPKKTSRYTVLVTNVDAKKIAVATVMIQ